MNTKVKLIKFSKVTENDYRSVQIGKHDGSTEWILHQNSNLFSVLNWGDECWYNEKTKQLSMLKSDLILDIAYDISRLLALLKEFNPSLSNSELIELVSIALEHSKLH